MNNDTARQTQAARQSCPYLNAKQTAFYLGLSPTTLKDMRARNEGPKCRRHGRLWRYHINDIESWSESRACGGHYG